MSKLCSLIMKKRDGNELTHEEIRYFIDRVVNNEADDAQTGAMLMAMYLQGLNKAETAALTHAMIYSGTPFQWPEEWKHLIVDKHSTGGVGDKVSLALVPALVSCGLKVPMISGRALGLTGGTLDKLEAIPGYQVLLTRKEIEDSLEKVGCCIAGQTEEMAPADRALYTLRDLTATVSSEPLITGSIMSKKLSEGLSALVLDVKFGKGTVMQSTVQESIKFAKKMMSACRNTDTKVASFVTSMDIPLGRKIGCSLEVEEVIDVLQGKGPADLVEMVSKMGGKLLLMTNQVSSFEEGTKKILKSLNDGSALAKFKEMLTAVHHVNKDIADALCRNTTPLKEIMVVAPFRTTITYEGNPGHVSEVDAAVLGNLWREEHDNAAASEDKKHRYSVGFELLVGHGDKISKGDPWIVFHHHQPQLSTQQLEKLRSCLQTVPNPPESFQRIACIIDGN